MTATDITSADSVVGKTGPRRPFGNDPAMFVRVRRRKLGGHHYGRQTGERVYAAASFDVVRAVRINGKPRQKFLFGLGSLKDPVSAWFLMHFWCDAIRKMRKNNLDDGRCRRLFDAMLRKGVPKPPRDLFEEFVQSQHRHVEAVAILAEFLGSPVDNAILNDARAAYGKLREELAPLLAALDRIAESTP